MVNSNFIYIEDDAIEVGREGENAIAFAEGAPVSDNGRSDFVFEGGTGLGGLTESGDFTVTISQTNSPVGETAVLQAEVEVGNESPEDKSGAIALYIDGTQVTATPITVPAGESLKLNVEWQTEDGDAGDYTATAKSGIDQDSAAVTVEAVDNPADKVLKVTTDDVGVGGLTLSDSVQNDYATATVVSPSDEYRFVDASVVYEQQGDVFGSNEKGNWGLKHGGDTGSFDDFDVRYRFDQGGRYDGGGRYDLGRLQSSDLTVGVDDGEGTTSER